MKAANFLAEQLGRFSGPSLFGVSGANIEDLFSAVHHKRLNTIVLAKNEYNACTMAMGHYLSSKKITSVLVTSGPGILNTVGALAEGHSSRIPFLVIAGQVPIELEGLGAFQDTTGLGESFDLLKLLSSLCFVQKINSAPELSVSLSRALNFCQKEKRPSVLLVPKNIFSEEITDCTLLAEYPKFAEEKMCSEDQKIKAQHFCRDLVNGPFPPLVLMGEELVHEQKLDALMDFIQKSSAAVALTPNSKGLWDHHHSHFLGLAGIMGHSSVENYLEQSEHVLLVGTKMDHLTRMGLEQKLNSKKVLKIRSNKGQDDDDVIEGNINDLFEDLCQTLSKDPGPSPVVMSGPEMTAGTADHFSYKNCIELIERQMDKTAHVFIDAGNSGAFVVHHLKLRAPGLCHVSLGMGGMGNSIGMGIGSAAANGKKSYVFCGDGSFLMHGLEVHTAREHNLPVTFFVFNNQSHAMCSTREDLFLGGRSGINDFLRQLKLGAMAQLLPGINSYDVYDLEELFYALDEVERAPSAVNIISINLINNEIPPFKTFNEPRGQK